MTLTFGIGNESFTLYVEPKEEALLIKHSKPKDPKMRGGVLFPWKKSSIYQGHLAAPNDMDISVFFSPLEQEDVMRPVMLCMGGLKKKIKSRQQYYYQGKPTTLKEASYYYDGQMHGIVTSGHGKGYIRAEFFPSSGTVPSYPTFDEVTAKDPFTAIRYIHNGAEHEPSIIVNDDYVVGGVLARMIFQNAASYRRVTDHYRQFWIVKTSIPQDFAFSKGTARYFWQQSSCWILFEKYGTFQRFTKLDRTGSEES